MHVFLDDFEICSLPNSGRRHENDIYNIPLPRGLGPQKKKKKQKKTTNVGQITRGELKRRIPDGDTKYLLGTIV
jgi:hypothetical protein